MMEVTMSKYGEKMQEIANQMEATEQTLLATGFPPKQWELIKEYIRLAAGLTVYGIDERKKS